jgi:hypothetical protein
MDLAKVKVPDLRRTSEGLSDGGGGGGSGEFSGVLLSDVDEFVRDVCVEDAISTSTKWLRLLRSSPRRSGASLLPAFFRIEIMGENSEELSSKHAPPEKPRLLAEFSMRACCISPRVGIVDKKTTD